METLKNYKPINGIPDMDFEIKIAWWSAKFIKHLYIKRKEKFMKYVLIGAGTIILGIAGYLSYQFIDVMRLTYNSTQKLISNKSKEEEKDVQN